MRNAECKFGLRSQATSDLTFRIPNSTFRIAALMDLGLAGRVALVCGSTKGLGRAVAKALAHEGARVAVNGRHEDAAERAAQQLSSETGQQVMAFVADVGERGEAEGLVERVHHEMGRVDVLFCNASGPPAAPFAHQSADAFQRAVELNLLS